MFNTVNRSSGPGGSEKEWWGELQHKTDCHFHKSSEPEGGRDLIIIFCSFEDVKLYKLYKLYKGGDR